MLAMEILMVLIRIFQVFKICVERDLGKTSISSLTFMGNSMNLDIGIMKNILLKKHFLQKIKRVLSHQYEEIYKIIFSILMVYKLQLELHEIF